MTEAKPATPTLDKLKSVRADSQVISAFVEWLETQDVHLASHYEHELLETHQTVEQLLAGYFEIDLKAVESERRALLDYQRALNRDRSDMKSEFYIKGPPDKVQHLLNNQFTRLSIVEFFTRTAETWELNVEVHNEEVDNFTDKCEAAGVEVKLV